MGEAPSPRESAPSLPAVGRFGQTPASDDHSAEAASWRAEMARKEAREAMTAAQTALRENAETRTAVEKLDTTLKHLDATIKASDSDWSTRTKTLKRLAWFVVSAAIATSSPGDAVAEFVWRALSGLR